MRWKILPQKSSDLSEQLLINRGLKTKKEKEEFFNPKISNYENDLNIPEIQKAKIRILKAIKNEELIVVYGDYDVDGICASAILYKGLTSIGAKVLPYIPHREKEGYGLSKLGLEHARDSGASLVITVDNGITAKNQAEFAKEIGLDLIITDHHILSDKKPQAYAIVHSTKMCGAAVAWCLISGMVKDQLKEELLQFAALATVCDLIPLTGLGRAFLVEGLRVLNNTTNLGLLSLINESGLNPGEISSYEIGHILGPRLNAMGRLEHAIDSLRLLCTKDSLKAKNLTGILIEANVRRQELTQLAMEQARVMIEESSNIHVLYSKQWISGIIGLIAGRVAEETGRPSIAISVGEIISKGSARSTGINIVETIRKLESFLIDVGGHKGAAGFTIETKRIEQFKIEINKIFKETKIEEKVLEIEAQLESKQLTKSLIGQLQKFEPFGFRNPKPIFTTKGLQISDIRTVGDGKHLKFKVSTPRHPDPPVGGEGSIDCIAFGMGQLASDLKNNQMIDLAYNLEINKFNGSETLQLKVKDIKTV